VRRRCESRWEQMRAGESKGEQRGTDEKREEKRRADESRGEQRKGEESRGGTRCCLRDPRAARGPRCSQDYQDCDSQNGRVDKG
jgi:hypothetical protein